MDTRDAYGFTNHQYKPGDSCPKCSDEMRLQDGKKGERTEPKEHVHVFCPNSECDFWTRSIDWKYE